MPGIFPGVFYLLYRKPRVYPGLDALVLEQCRPDAHDVDHLARHFERAEELLAKMNYTNRWRLKR